MHSPEYAESSAGLKALAAEACFQHPKELLNPTRRTPSFSEKRNDGDVQNAIYHTKHGNLLLQISLHHVGNTRAQPGQIGTINSTCKSTRIEVLNRNLGKRTGNLNSPIDAASGFE